MSESQTSTTVDIVCRVCATKNRIPVDRAHKDLGAVQCGSCRGPLLRVHGEPLTDVPDDALAHPWDREALDKLKSIPLLDTIISKVMGGTFDKMAEFQMMAGTVRVSEKQAPRLWRLYLEAAGRIDVDPPPLFLAQSPLVNAWTSGAGKPLLGITTALVNQLDDRGICGVLGHELTHVRLGHVLYRTLAVMMAQGALRILDFFGLAKLALRPLQIALTRWSQMSELSADRGELITTGSLETYVRTHMMLAGGSATLADELDVGEFIQQAHDAEAMRDNDLLISILELFQQNQRSHPLTVWRVHHGLKWAQTPAFFELLAGPTRVRLENA